jgi:hypothetical protein
MSVHNATPKSFLGVIIFLAITTSIINAPLNLLRATYFSNKLKVEVLYQDKQTTRVILITRENYMNWLRDHKGLTPVFGSFIPEHKIYCANTLYSIWTHNN